MSFHYYVKLMVLKTKNIKILWSRLLSSDHSVDKINGFCWTQVLNHTWLITKCCHESTSQLVISVMKNTYTHVCIDTGTYMITHTYMFVYTQYHTWCDMSLILKTFTFHLTLRFTFEFQKKNEPLGLKKNDQKDYICEVFFLCKKVFKNIFHKEK